MAETCATCRFWKRRQPEKRGGQCRRHAPVSIAVGEGRWRDWPATGDTDWCGDYQPGEAVDCDQAPMPMLTACPSCGAESGHLHLDGCRVRALKERGVSEGEARAQLFPESL